jgi:FtsP/CotA-like multicopper oxidase with cupredoxin domain
MGTPISRRQSLKLLGAGAVMTVTGCRSGSEADPGVGSRVPGEATVGDVTPASAPGAVTLADEVADVHLRLWAEPSTAEIVAGTTTDVWSFGAEVLEGDPATVQPSGSYLGPTLHLRQGQRVRVSFENRLDEDGIVHWHGLHVPQDQDGQPPEVVGPGRTYEYDFVVVDRPGTRWYHPHPHARTGEQVYRGLAGLLVVHGEEPPSLAGVAELALVLQDRRLGPDGTLSYIGSRHDTMAGFTGETLVTNGRGEYTVEVERRPYRLRLLNGANSRTSLLSLSVGESLTVIATDGNLLAQASEVPSLVLTPAQRADVWIDFSAYEPGERVELLSADTFVESMAMMGGMGMGGGMGAGSDTVTELDVVNQVAATFVIGGGTGDDEPRPPDDLAPFAPDAVDPGQAVTAEAKTFALSTRRATHWINDSLWEGREVTEQETVTADTVELWDFVNYSPMAHPMHLHGRSFSVVERSWDDDTLASTWDTLAPGVIDDGLRDTVLVFPGQRVRIAVPFGGYEGYFLYHCHILEHEDMGMMRSFRVVAG